MSFFLHISSRFISARRCPCLKKKKGGLRGRNYKPNRDGTNASSVRFVPEIVKRDYNNSGVSSPGGVSTQR